MTQACGRGQSRARWSAGAAHAAAAPPRLGEVQGSSVLWDGGAGACGGAGQTQGTEGALGRGGSEEGSVIENGGKCAFL